MRCVYLFQFNKDAHGVTEIASIADNLNYSL